MKTVFVMLIVMQLGAYLLFRYTFHRRWHNDSNCYKLFKIRDELIELVAMGKLSEDEFLFKYFYTANNLLIQHCREIDFNLFVSSLRDEINVADLNFVNEIERHLERKNDLEVGQMIENFYDTVANIAISNSFLLRLLGRFESLRQLAKYFLQFGKYYGRYDEKWRTYTSYVNAKNMIKDDIGDIKLAHAN